MFSLVAILVLLVFCSWAAYATAPLSRSQAKVALTMKIASSKPLSRHANGIDLRPLIPLGGLPMFPAVLLWFPESDNMSDVQVVGVQSEPSNPPSRSYRWLRIGMLVLFGMGLLGMLFG